MTPTLSQVISSGGTPSMFNFTFAAAGLAAMAAVAVSLAVYRRTRIIPAIVDEPAADPHREEREKLSFLVDELKLEKLGLQTRGAELETQLHGMNEDLNNLKQSRDVLEKSNLALTRECDKLKAAAPAAVQLEMVKIKSKPKAEVKAKAKAKKAKKEEARKPRRVSRKKK